MYISISIVTIVRSDGHTGTCLQSPDGHTEGSQPVKPPTGLFIWININFLGVREVNKHYLPPSLTHVGIVDRAPVIRSVAS